MNDLIERISEIERRLRGLKAKRKIDFTQLQLFSEEWSYSLTLPASSIAQYKVTIVCAGDPIADVAADGFPLGVNDTIHYGGYFANVTGNTVEITLLLANLTGSSHTVSLTIRAWALNGLSATCERTV